MKRIYLVSPGSRRYDDAGKLCVDEAVLRAAILALGSWATNDGRGAVLGDPAHEEVTEGRRKASEERIAKGSKEVPYSSCGDLIHWMLRCLGCRDENLVNRNDDGGTHPWQPGVNISRFTSCAYRRHNFTQTLAGDAVFVSNQWGGHIALVRSWDVAGGTAIVDEYGQPYGARHTKRLTANGQVLGGSPVVFVIDLSAVPLAQTAAVPDDFDRGTPDDNPYPEQGVPA